MDIEKEILVWSNGSEYWFQYATNQLLEGHNCDDTLIDQCYALFLEDKGLKEIESERQAFERSKSADRNQSNETILLKKIKNIQNVNALTENQEIEISSGLTIVFGENGTGKSGYTRLLNNAFNSRGDKDILPDIGKEDAQGVPKCTFEFGDDSTNLELNYPIDEENQIFNYFSVFDSKAGNVQLTQENNLIFTPKGFDYFENLINIISGIKERLATDISKASKPNEFETNFRFENSIQSFVSNLDHSTDLKELEQFEEFSQEEQESIEGLLLKKKELSEENIPKKIEDLNKRKTEIRKLGENINSYLSKIAKDDIELYNSLIELKIDLEKREKEQGIKSLEKYAIKNIGSNEWKEFIQKTSEYIDSIISSKSEVDKCPLCLQNLNDNEIQLFDSYWKLLKSEVQKELIQVKSKISKALDALDALPLIKFDSSIVVFNYIKDGFPHLAERIQEIITHCQTTKSEIQKGLQSNSILVLQIKEYNVKFLNEPVIAINELGKKLIEKNPEKEIIKIQNRINELNDKKLLVQLKPSIVKWIKELKWANHAKSCMSDLKTNKITKKQGELFQTEITEKYKAEFEKECKLLRAPEVVEINQRNRHGTTLRRLEIKGNSANKILSEGEQKAISLADFFTENGLDSDNKGVIFDDPVTSLDHKRRKLITKRIIASAKEKQVIVFTHSISFLMELERYAEQENIEYFITTIRRIRSDVGVISPDLPWIAQKVSKRVGFLKNALQKLKKIESEGTPAEYEQAISSWYRLLREGWERAVEERLFKGAIARFGYGVSTIPLKKIEINQDLIARIEKGMTESSDWLHDSAVGLNPTLPTSEDALESINQFEEFTKICKA